jgi:Arm DNA-binding domain
MSPLFAVVRLYPRIICGSGRGYKLGGHLDASHRKTHGAEGRAGKTAGALWRRRWALPAGHRARFEVMDLPFLDCRAGPYDGQRGARLPTNKIKGRSREMGLGSCSTVSLAEARDRAAECRKLREQEIDPIEARETARRQAALERAKSLKFREAAATYIATHRVAWKNDKHAAQWTSTLET